MRHVYILSLFSLTLCALGVIACDDSATAGNNTSCVNGDTCTQDCKNDTALCNMSCSNGAKCSATCQAGQTCNFACEGESSCDFDCSQGSCNISTDSSASCMVTGNFTGVCGEDESPMVGGASGSNPTACITACGSDVECIAACGV